VLQASSKEFLGNTTINLRIKKEIECLIKEVIDPMINILLLREMELLVITHLLQLEKTRPPELKLASSKKIQSFACAFSKHSTKNKLI